MKAHDRESQSTFSPQKALQFLREGNVRFVNNLRINRNLLQQVNETTDGQWPFATILSCIDSRTSAELIFDQGLGDIFSVRIAGNIVNQDILGSLEFACEVAGSKLIAVLGHSGCGAIKGACKKVEMGNLTGLLSKIAPAVEQIGKQAPHLTPDSSDFVEQVARLNVHQSIEEILNKSQIIRNLVEGGRVGIVGGMYSVENGIVDFFEQKFNV